MDPGDLVAATRRRQGLTQRQLAIRAGTSQASISRIERGRESPTLERLGRLLLAMSERLVLSTEPLTSPLDAGELAAARALSPRERLLESMTWNLVATQLEIAGSDARRR